MLAGVGAGLCTPEAAREMFQLAKSFEPKMDASERTVRLARWEEAVLRARTMEGQQLF
jgi:glycerol kinase